MKMQFFGNEICFILQLIAILQENSFGERDYTNDEKVEVSSDDFWNTQKRFVCRISTNASQMTLLANKLWVHFGFVYSAITWLIIY